MVYPSHSIPIDWHKPYGKTAEQSKSVTQKFNARDFSFTKLQLTTKLKKKRKEEETEAEDGGKLNVWKYKLIEAIWAAFDCYFFGKISFSLSLWNRRRSIDQLKQHRQKTNACKTEITHTRTHTKHTIFIIYR